MTPDDIIKLLDATCICGARKLHDPIQHAFAADLMSDVLRLNTEGLLLITKSCYCVAVKVCSGYAENCIKPGFFRCIKKTYGIQF